MIKYTILLFLGILGLQLQATHLDVQIFSTYTSKSFEMEIYSGRYHLWADGQKILELPKGEKMQVTAQDGKVLLKNKDYTYGPYSRVNFKGKSFINIFKVHNQNQIRIYDDDLLLNASGLALRLVNHVDLEHYVAGVVQSESGSSNKNIEYFFVQAIISRTYALVNYLKHKADGFNLCDETHCQYYVGRCTDANIAQAVARTGGDVIVDGNGKMISAAYHSNCGGQTMNSEDVWTLPTSYLKSVKDSFCLNATHAHWEKKISKTAWLSYLAYTFNYPVQDSAKQRAVLDYHPSERTAFLVDSIPLKQIRLNQNLNSTFFSIEEDGEQLVFHGKGFGHGVGLCQEGAIEMIRQGLDYKQVIQYYYTNVRILHYTELHYNFMP